jgi:hypothetical protein
MGRSPLRSHNSSALSCSGRCRLELLPAPLLKTSPMRLPRVVLTVDPATRKVLCDSCQGVEKPFTARPRSGRGHAALYSSWGHASQGEPSEHHDRQALWHWEPKTTVGRAQLLSLAFQFQNLLPQLHHEHRATGPVRERHYLTCDESQSPRGGEVSRRRRVHTYCD